MFDPYTVSIANGTSSCVKILDVLSNISAAGFLTLDSVPTIGNTILGISSNFLNRWHLSGYNTTSDNVIKSIRNSVYVIQKVLLSSMLPGSSPVTIASPNIRITGFFDSLQSLYSGVVSPLPTQLESRFSTALPVIALSSAGLSDCYDPAVATNHLPYSVAYWSGFSPSGRLDRVDTTVMSVAVPLVPDSATARHYYNTSSTFDVTLNYFRKQSFSNSSVPVLDTLVGSKYSRSGLNCSVQQYAAFNATLRCQLAASLCRPNSGRFSGTGLVAHGMKVTDLAGTFRAVSLSTNVKVQTPISVPIVPYLLRPSLLSSLLSSLLPQPQR